MAWAAALELYGPDTHDRLLELWGGPWAPVRKLWGTDPSAQAGQRAMMALAGAPAPPRDPSKRRRRQRP